MQTGTKISAVVHVTLLGWAFLGGVFRSDPKPFEVQDVTVISAEEYAALSAQQAPPAIAAEVSMPEATPAPDTEVAAPEPVPETPPTRPIPPKPAPEPEPVPAPLPPPVAPVQQPAPNETASVVAEAPRPPARRVERVAPEAIAPPPPEAEPDPVLREEVIAEAAPSVETPREQQQATAPEEAVTEITPETTREPEPQALAPSASPRPATRPQRRPEGPVETAAAEAPKPDTPKPETPKPAVSKPETPKPATPAESAATRSGVASALAEAMGGAGETRAPARGAPAGPPLSAGEKESLRVAVSACWNVGSLSSAALSTTVTVAVSLTPDGKPEIGTIRMVDSSGGDERSAKQAFDAARRAIIRCGSKGYTLPADKYDQWRDIEMTFNPERMRIK
ncbi:hypothetical protein [Pseudodonghicola xiamenensis]|uniref:Cell envelope integrity/translocation protein TolA n=1 Tax=Pseudodonghicola xiamenensis TaxID=337702 RepID=A0A8J3H5D8_9RHOB|nr:hypothetical protein [Pseudodonghicola xiamenensis]GHG84209.1 cell envelope integrity/translocation protein TolA [Pseudodonghicola xiamenensis]